MLLIATALAAQPVDVAASGLRPGEVLVDVGLGMHMNGRFGVPVPSLIRAVESWHPATVRAQLGAVDLGPVTLVVGADAHWANQSLVNPGMAVRRTFTNWTDRVPPLLLGLVPRWLRLPTAGAESDWRWRLRSSGYAGQVLLQLDRLETTPHLMLGMGRVAYEARAVHRREDARVRTVNVERSSVVVGGGASRSIRGFSVAAAVRMSFVLPDLRSDMGVEQLFGLAGDDVWTLPGEEVRIPRRMRPARVVLQGSVGYRFGRRGASPVGGNARK